MCRNKQLINTNKNYTIKQHLDCNVRNVIYLITCNACQKQYVGSTTNFKPRFNLYKSDIKYAKKSCSCVQHFGKVHSWSDFRIQPIEQVYIPNDLTTSEKENKLYARERHWMAELRTIHLGMNDRNDISLQLRRNFKE